MTKKLVTVPLFKAKAFSKILGEVYPGHFSTTKEQLIERNLIKEMKKCMTIQ